MNKKRLLTGKLDMDLKMRTVKYTVWSVVPILPGCGFFRFQESFHEQF